MPIPKVKLLEILNRIPLFKGLNAMERERVAAARHMIRAFKAEDKLIKYGDMDDSFYILLAGTASVVVGEHKVADIDAGDFVGEVGFICGERRTASVVANSDIVALSLNHKAFSDVPVGLREKIKDKMISGLVNRIDTMNQELNLLRSEKKLAAESSSEQPDSDDVENSSEAKKEN